MITEMVLETSVQYTHLTRLIAREDFIGKKDSCQAEGFLREKFPMHPQRSISVC
jgi:hypothetical protein